MTTSDIRALYERKEQAWEEERAASIWNTIMRPNVTAEEAREFIAAHLRLAEGEGVKRGLDMAQKVVAA